MFWTQGGSLSGFAPNDHVVRAHHFMSLMFAGSLFFIALLIQTTSASAEEVIEVGTPAVVGQTGWVQVMRPTMLSTDGLFTVSHSFRSGDWCFIRAGNMNALLVTKMRDDVGRVVVVRGMVAVTYHPSERTYGLHCPQGTDFIISVNRFLKETIAFEQNIIGALGAR